MKKSKDRSSYIQKKPCTEATRSARGCMHMHDAQLHASCAVVYIAPRPDFLHGMACICIKQLGETCMPVRVRENWGKIYRGRARYRFVRACTPCMRYIQVDRAKFNVTTIREIIRGLQGKLNGLSCAYIYIGMHVSQVLSLRRRRVLVPSREVMLYYN